MSEQTGGGSGAAGTEREMREHERQARERDPDERSADDTGGGSTTGMSDGGVGAAREDADDTAPPGTAGRASSSLG